jgi:hypothetical protein
MSTLDWLDNWVWWLQIAACVVLSIRFWWEELGRIYRCFSIYLAFCAPAWLFWQPRRWGGYLENLPKLTGLRALRNYRGIASLGRWAICAGLVIAVVITSLTLPLDFGHLRTTVTCPAPVRYELILDRGVTSCLVLFIIWMAVFLAFFGVPLSRNIVLFMIGYAVLFLSCSVAGLVHNIGGHAYLHAFNIARSGAVVCFMMWSCLLNRQGESTPAVAWPRSKPSHGLSSRDRSNRSNGFR